MPHFLVDTELHNTTGKLWIMRRYKAEDEADALAQNTQYWAGKSHVIRPLRVTVTRVEMEETAS